MHIKKLVDDIIPHYNNYRKNRFLLSGVEVLEISWVIGDFLQKFINQNKVAPHTLYREIYGKSDGKENIIQKSYITREFLGRCFRIRKIFKDQNEIIKDLPTLINFNNFREAMPFFDNQKYKLKGEEKENLLKILNSKIENKKIKEYIKNLQLEKIGIKNPRNQKLGQMSEDKEIFVKFYNYIYRLLDLNDYKRACREINDIDIQFIKILSKNVSALSIDGLLMTGFDLPNNLNRNWVEFSGLVKRFIEKKSSLERRRLRRLIPPSRMTQMGEMLYQLTSESLYKTFRS